MIGPELRPAAKKAAELGVFPATWQLDDGAWGRAPLHTFEGSLGGRVSVWLHWATYDRACLAALGTPHCAIALNAGLGVVTYRWADAIEILSAARTPFIVTDYYEAGLWIGCQLPAVKRSLELTYPITLNPFRQPLVWPEASKSDPHCRCRKVCRFSFHTHVQHVR